MALPHTHHQRARSTTRGLVAPETARRGAAAASGRCPGRAKGRVRGCVCVCPFHTGHGGGRHSGPVTPAMCAEVRVSQKTGLLSKFWKDSACSGLWPTPVLLGADWDTWEAWPRPCGLQGEVTILSLPVVTRSEQGARSHSEV